MTVAVTVVIPVYNGGTTIAMCLGAIASQSIPPDTYEIIVVDDGSKDNTAEIASQFPAQLLKQENQGAPAARNRGIQEARGTWIAFTDADCIPSRNWLEWLLRAVEKGHSPTKNILGAAGRIIGYGSETEASRFVDLMGGLDSERHLAHPLYPFAVFGNTMYRRDCLNAIGGVDSRFYTYDACDLHTRLIRHSPGEFHFVPKAVVLHHHRPDWTSYRRQQFGYGKGLGQFYWKYRKEVRWSFRRELGAWASLLPMGFATLFKKKGDEALLRRGHFLKNLFQRCGFIRTYWNPRERKRWQTN